MKSLLKYTFIGLLSVGLFASCSEDRLETQPTTQMSGATLMTTSTAAMVPLNGIYRTMYEAGYSVTGNTHQTFGNSAYVLMAEVMGEDYVQSSSGNGWFWYDAIYNVKARYTSSAWRSYDLWFEFYKWIANANYILAYEETMEGDDVDYVIGQAYAIRAYAYYMLSQCFARTYVGHENEPCAPLYTEPTVPTTTGQPRATVAQVYQQITADIDKAVSLLPQAKHHDDTAHIDYAVAQGIRARIYLTMGEWQKAKEAAKEAIAKSGKSIQPVSAFLGLNNASAGNVLWGATIITDQVGMYASLYAHTDYEADKYGGKSPKLISTWLYDRISDTDARKTAWWNANHSVVPYIQEKQKFSDIQTWMGDYVWMRIEEMYLIAAEAECRLGDEGAAKEDLMALMSKRDPNYTCNKTGTALGALTTDETGSLLEEIILQRRIELWGEAGRVWDIRRLKQGFRRTTDMGWPQSALLSNRPTTNPENYMWVLTIPQAEFDGNENMNADTDQNPAGDL